MGSHRADRERRKNELPRLLEVQEVAYMLALDVPRVWALIEEGEFVPPLEFADKKRWRMQDVKRFLRLKAVSAYRIYLDAQQRKVKVTTLVPAKVPPLLSEWKCNLLEFIEFPPCVYFILKDDRVMYVGKTRQLSKRLLSHKYGNRKKPPRDFDGALYMPLPAEVLAGIELDFIHRLRPPWNEQGVC